ncbi:MAG: DUF2974 domain-containing protein [Lachnospiraceae bacterium]|nr:DUF2974 domain-containing protein [Lachnospiraceae bacterium]
MLTDEEISMVLNTYMYMDYKEAADGMTVNEIVKDLSDSNDCQEGGIHYGEYTVLAQAAENPEIGELIIGNQSHLLSFDSGTNACTFETGDGSSIYVVYRGTADGEWPDNGLGMTEVSTLQQERALTYFETVVEKEHFSQEQKLIITGHSKGGNKAQYVTMATKYNNLLDACYNIDGQGFSEAAIQNWKNTYGEKGYLDRTSRITGIYGENDYVNVLGCSIVPKDQVHYVKTPVKVENFAGYHDIKYMFASLETDPKTGKEVSVFHGRKNSYVQEQGKLGSYASSLSAAVMNLPPDKRDGCAAALMQLMELSGDKKTGINGEKLTLSDLADFFGTGIPLIAESMLFTQNGKDMLESALFRKSFSQDMNGKITAMVDYTTLLRQVQMLMKMEEELENACSRIEDISKKLSVYMKNSWMINMKLKTEGGKIEKDIMEMNKLSSMLEKIVKIYMETDVTAADEILMI